MKKVRLYNEKDKIYIPQTGNYEEFEISSIKIIEEALNTAPQGGFDFAEQKKRLKLIDKLEILEPNASEIELENADFETLSTCMKTFKCGVLSRSIVKFQEQFQ